VEFARILSIFCLQLAIVVPSISLDQYAKRRFHALAIHAKIQELASTHLIFLASRAIVPQLILPEPFVRH